MKLEEKVKIRIVYIAAAALIAAALLGAFIYHMSVSARMRAAADAVEFNVALRQTEAAVNTARQSAALEREQEKWNGYAQQLELRLDERRQELLILVTELTANSFCARFIARYGCEEYYRHNEELMFYQRRTEIIKDLEKLQMEL